METRFGSKAFIGAIAGGLIAIGIPVSVTAYSAIKYKDAVGANIGLGLLLLGLPVYLAIAIILGWTFGRVLERMDSRKRKQEAGRSDKT